MRAPARWLCWGGLGFLVAVTVFNQVVPRSSAALQQTVIEKKVDLEPFAYITAYR